MSYQSYYKVVNSSGDAIIDHSPKNGSDICFANYINKFSGNNTVYTYLLKDYGKVSRSTSYAENIFTKNDVFEYLELLNKNGFVISIEESDKFYTFTLKESDYLNGVHVRVALDYLRLLWEGHVNKILVDYLKIPTAIKNKYNGFELLQICSIRVGDRHEAHYPPSIQYLPSKFYVVSSSEMLEALKNLNGISSTFGLWSNIASKKFAEYKKKVNQSKALIKPEKLEELTKLVFDSDYSVRRGYQICNPKLLAEIEQEKSCLI